MRVSTQNFVNTQVSLGVIYGVVVQHMYQLKFDPLLFTALWQAPIYKDYFG